MKNRKQAVRTVDEYLQLPYTLEIQRDEGMSHSGWFARVRELPGCMTQAERFEELGPMIEDAMRAWIETAIEDGQPVPEPREQTEYSGKFVLRVPRTLHRQLVETAEAEGVSLNQLCSTLLAQAIGAAARPAPAMVSATFLPRKAVRPGASVAVQEEQAGYDQEQP
ncbi:MAG: HicB family protein [Chloroflexi bacterium ADurb.Bin325]|nr:MAG: HicB family protein [Chloroflexi bacterium ADurb.Bin325]